VGGNKSRASPLAKKGADWEILDFREERRPAIAKFSEKGAVSGQYRGVFRRVLPTEEEKGKRICNRGKKEGKGGAIRTGEEKRKGGDGGQKGGCFLRKKRGKTNHYYRARDSKA